LISPPHPPLEKGGWGDSKVIFLAMQKIETPKGNEKYFSMKGSREKIALRKKLMMGELISFSDSILRPKR